MISKSGQKPLQPSTTSLQNTVEQSTSGTGSQSSTAWTGMPGGGYVNNLGEFWMGAKPPTYSEYIKNYLEKQIANQTQRLNSVTIREVDGEITVTGDINLIRKYVEQDPSLWLRLMALKEEENSG